MNNRKMDMKGGALKPLHLARSMTALIERSNVQVLPIKVHRSLDRMSKLHNIAVKARKEGDQEMEFMFLHRYHLVVAKLTQNAEYKRASKNYKAEKETAKCNFDRYSFLYKTLEGRYREQSETISRLDSEALRIENLEATKPSNGVQEKPEVKKPEVSIKCEELYSLIKNKNNKASLLILDSRSSIDFQESHIHHPNVINIPEEVIEKGLSASLLGKKLKAQSQILWNKRHSFDRLILHDWNSTESSVKNSKLLFLKEAMTKWEVSIKYKCPPLILEGGFEEVLDRYPLILTNPKIQTPFRKDSFIVNNLDSLTYPLADISPKPMAPPPQPKEPELVKQRSISPKQVVIPDRSTKPKQMKVADAALPPSLPSEEITEELVNSPVENNDFSNPKEETKMIVNDPKPDLALEELRKVKPPDPPTPASPSIPSSVVSDDSSSSVDVEHMPLKKDDSPSSILKRASSTPNISQLKDDDTKMPNFTRNNKPKQLPFYGDRADVTYGKTAAGLTGLKNFANNCYMNSIVQCLSNTEVLVKELIDLNKPALNPSSKTKGQVAQEVITTLRHMWSGEVKVHNIKELKGLMGDIKDIFKGTSHQDSNEFLIILLEYLHEDLNISNTVHNNLDGAEEATGEKAWGEFLKKNCSVIQRLFYGQQRSTILCSTCSHSSVTFEPFFNLFVPIPSTQEKVTLNECIKLYMAGEKISGWKCPKCKTERNAMKKFDISKLPPVLIVALKRFTQEDDSWLHKKENVVTYPLEGLNMENYTVNESEQRFTTYNLYAVSTHTGTLRSGHYKAICKNPVNRKWYMFDDQSIDPLASHSVENNPEAYILFYNAVK